MVLYFLTKSTHYLCSAGIKSDPGQNLLFHFHSYGDGNGLQSKVPEVPERLETANSREHSVAKLLEVFNGENRQKSEIVSAEVEYLHFCGKRSVVELLDGLQDRTSLLKINSKMVAFLLTSTFSFSSFYSSLYPF